MYKEFIAKGTNPENYGVYPKSVNEVDGKKVFMAEAGGQTVIIADATLGFEGESFDAEGKAYVKAPLSNKNGNVLRKLFPFTAPISVLKKERSFGVGDRLGIASFGHIKVFEKFDAYPVLAQQSIRELTLTNRTYEDVLDSASFAVYREGFKKGFGADGDHLKKPEDVKYALDLGFTMITLDCSEYIGTGIEDLSAEEVDARYKKDEKLEAKYIGKEFNIGEGETLTFSEDEFKRIVLIYGEAVEFATKIYNDFFASGKYDADFEISIDETMTPTTPLQHFFVANELIDRGVKIATMAPRFCGEFQKGIDYIGDLAQFDSEMKVHATIARHFGYKLSIHSGSDKFSAFPYIGKHTQGVFHVKTAGTNWLEAMRVTAITDAKLYREVHKYALEAFAEASTYYHVTTDLAKIPSVDTLSDEELPTLFDQNDARQLIHITYGLILQKKNADGSFTFRDRLYKNWKDNEDVYADALLKHIGRHLRDLGVAEI